MDGVQKLMRGRKEKRGERIERSKKSRERVRRNKNGSKGERGSLVPEKTLEERRKRQDRA